MFINVSYDTLDIIGEIFKTRKSNQVTEQTSIIIDKSQDI